MHAEADGARSPPLDIVANAGTPALFVPPLADCLVMAAEARHAGSGTLAIPIANDCAAEVTIDDIALRAPTAGLTVRTRAPVAIAPSSAASIEVDVAGDVEEILLVRVATPEAGTRAVTIRR